MGAVDDHTRTLLNLATDLSGLRHSCRTQKEVAALFFKFFSMAVKDVSDAFPLIPLHPDLWPFMLFQWIKPTSHKTEKNKSCLDMKDCICFRRDRNS